MLFFVAQRIVMNFYEGGKNLEESGLALEFVVIGQLSCVEL